MEDRAVIGFPQLKLMSIPCRVADAGQWSHCEWLCSVVELKASVYSHPRIKASVLAQTANRDEPHRTAMEVSSYLGQNFNEDGNLKVTIDMYGYFIFNFRHHIKTTQL